jgi:hypothetical protein
VIPKGAASGPFCARQFEVDHSVGERNLAQLLTACSRRLSWTASLTNFFASGFAASLGFGVEQSLLPIDRQDPRGVGAIGSKGLRPRAAVAQVR